MTFHFHTITPIISLGYLVKPWLNIMRICCYKFACVFKEKKLLERHLSAEIKSPFSQKNICQWALLI